MGATPNLVRAAGNSLSTTISSNITDSATTIQLTDGNGFNTSGGYIVIDPSNASKEIIYYESRSGNTLTVASDGRGRGGTSGVAHTSGAVVTTVLVDEHVEGIRTQYLLEHDDDGKHTKIDSAMVMSGSDAESTNKVADAGVIEPGWIPSGETWVFDSVDDPTGVIQITGVDKTSKYSIGMKIKFDNGGNTIFGKVTKVALNGSDTEITFLHEINFPNNVAVNALQNSAITNPFFSLDFAPYGFPMGDQSWTIITEDTTNATQASPTANTWYNLGTITIDVPIGKWAWNYQGTLKSDRASGELQQFITLSTANNSESDATNTSWADYLFDSDTVGDSLNVTPHRRHGLIEITTKDTYYLNAKVSASGTTSIILYGTQAPTLIIFTLAF